MSVGHQRLPVSSWVHPAARDREWLSLVILLLVMLKHYNHVPAPLRRVLLSL